MVIAYEQRRARQVRMTAAASNMNAGKASPRVPAVTRAVAILRLLAKAEKPLGVNAIAHTLGLVPSTCLHILRTLVIEELVSFNHTTKLYQLDVGVLTLARSIFRRNKIGGLIQPALDKLVESWPRAHRRRSDLGLTT
jgi:DNA-binding IclR family transcriptional regulator